MKHTDLPGRTAGTAFPSTALPEQPAQAPGAAGSRLRSALLALCVVAAAALVVAGARSAWQHWQASQGTHAQPGAPAGTAATTMATVAALSAQPAPTAAPGVAPGTAPAPSRLQAALHLAGQSEPLAGAQMALPSGARFELRITPAQAGQLEVYAVSPRADAPALLWAAPVRTAGATLTSPTLRLEGQRGVEQLRLLLRGARGQVLALQDIRIWHL